MFDVWAVTRGGNDFLLFKEQLLFLSGMYWSNVDSFGVNIQI